MRTIVSVGKGVEFVDDDIDVVAADAVTLTSDTFAFIHTSDGVELTAADLALLRVEMGSNGVNTGRITHEHHLVGQLLWLQMQVETRTVSIDDQFGFRKCSFHKLLII